jgi:hypothetical protein
MTRRVDRFAVTRSRRALLTLLLSVLLVGMRQEAQLHGLLHFLPFAVSQEQASHPSPEPSCAECKLLAAGSNGLVDNLTVLPAACDTCLNPQSTLVARALTAPSFYRSRAPPSLS